MNTKQLECVLLAAGFTVAECQNERIVRAVRLFLKATDTKDLQELANQLLELRRKS